MKQLAVTGLNVGGLVARHVIRREQRASSMKGTIIEATIFKE